MNIIFYRSLKDLDGALAVAFCEGARKSGHNCTILDTYEEPMGEVDMVVVVGVKGKSREIINNYQMMGKLVVYIDKGYIRIPDTRSKLKVLYWKVSLGGFQPLDYLMLHDMPKNRWMYIQKNHNYKMQPWREGNECITYSGPSAKNCAFHELGDPTSYAKQIVRTIHKRIQGPVIYRPKQSWKDARPVEGAEFSRPPERLLQVIKKSKLFVVHNSNSCVEAALHGVPLFSFGPSVGNPISETRPNRMNNLRFPEEVERQQWIQNVCYWQWTIAEMASGETWDFLKRFV